MLVANRGVGKSWFCARGFQLSAPNRWCRSCHCQSCYWTNPRGTLGATGVCCPITTSLISRLRPSQPRQSEIPHCPYAKMEQLTPSRAPRTRSSSWPRAPCAGDPWRPDLGDHVKDFALGGLRSEDPREAEAVPGTRSGASLTHGEPDNSHLQQIWSPNSKLLEIPQMQTISWSSGSWLT